MQETTDQNPRTIASDQIHSVADLMTTLQNEVNELKNDQLSESKARIVLGSRKAQIKLVELGIQYQRMERGKKVKEMPLLPGMLPQDAQK